MGTIHRLLLPIALALYAGSCRAAGPHPSVPSGPGPGAVLDDLHRLAAAADGEAYFALFEPAAVYIGTDASERWSLAEFQAYARPHFSRGRGWDYRVLERHVSLSADQRTAWFDERLHNASYGECRGSGVLVLGRHGWRIAQYVLSLPVPNELAGDLVERIRTLEAAPRAAPGSGGL
jgi:hypothetical protein